MTEEPFCENIFNLPEDYFKNKPELRERIFIPGSIHCNYIIDKIMRAAKTRTVICGVCDKRITGTRAVIKEHFSDHFGESTFINESFIRKTIRGAPK